MLSICITVYNQIDIVKWNLNTITQYPGNDIEIVVSDDCSNEDIRGLIESFHDSRIQYIRTPKNGGHDMNILFALDNCSGEYAWVLRSRDTVDPKEIGSVINDISKLENVGYILYSANDESGKRKLSLSEKRYVQGSQAIWAHTRVPIHPSGNIYKLEYIKSDKYRKYILNSFNHNYGFVVHDLIRMDLCSRSDLTTSSKVTWVYSNTLKSSDIAVNSNKYKSIFSPEYELDRFSCIFSYIAENFDGDNKKALLFWAIKRFYKSIAYNFKWLNNDKNNQKHYNYQPEKYNSTKAKEAFLEKLASLEKKYEIDDDLKKQTKKMMKNYNYMLFTIYPIKKRITNVINGSCARAQMFKVFKRI